MTKKDYEIIAGGIRYMVEKNSPNHDMYTLHGLANLYCLILEKQNPKFDRDKFITACGIEV